MKKNYVLWFALLAIIMLGCRSESINSEETNTISQQKFNVVSKSSIPSIINELQSKTNNFRISLKTNSSEGKTETAFGEIDTNYIISTEKDGETYYIFPIISQKSDSETKTYNLELKASEGTIEESKVLAYEPTDEWLLHGNDDYTSFSGTISTYDIGGDLENSSTYVNGKSGCTPQEPCPDCPVNPNGPGGTDGGGTPGGGWTGTGSGGGGGTTGGDGGGTSGGGSTGGVWLLHCETINKELKCWMVFYSQKVSVSACGGSAGGVITVYVPSSYINTILTQYHSSLALSESEKNFLNSHKDIANNLADFLRKNNTQQNAAFVKWAAWFFTANPNTTWEQFTNSKHNGEPNSSLDIQNNEAGNYDETSYENFDFQNQSLWPTINNVISVSDFVGWNAPGINKNCMDYAKAQIAKKGYKISNYYDVDSKGEKQTFQIYTEQNGANLNDLYKGVSYIKYALSKGIPVIVGVDDNPGSPGNIDNSTDHFVVIVGMGVDSKGQFFRFFDNASGIDPQNQGANPENKLYYNFTAKIFQGKTYCSVYRNSVMHDYIITMIRKSK